MSQCVVIKYQRHYENLPRRQMIAHSTYYCYYSFELLYFICSTLCVFSSYYFFHCMNIMSFIFFFTLLLLLFLLLSDEERDQNHTSNMHTYTNTNIHTSTQFVLYCHYLFRHSLGDLTVLTILFEYIVEIFFCSACTFSFSLSFVHALNCRRVDVNMYVPDLYMYEKRFNTIK